MIKGRRPGALPKAVTEDRKRCDQVKAHRSRMEYEERHRPVDAPPRFTTPKFIRDKLRGPLNSN